MADDLAVPPEHYAQAKTRPHSGVAVEGSAPLKATLLAREQSCDGQMDARLGFAFCDSPLEIHARAR
jgi:hypothetical protein